jgi:hypothetical protein
MIKKDGTKTKVACFGEEVTGTKVTTLKNYHEFKSQ